MSNMEQFPKVTISDGCGDGCLAEVNNLGQLSVNIAGADFPVTLTNLPNSQPSSVSTFGSDVVIAVKATAGTVFSLYAANRNAASRYLQVYAANNSTNGTPVFSFRIPIAGTLFVGRDFFGPLGQNIASGITVAVSTSSSTYVAATASETDLTVLYV